jgi:hypothetical protein
MNNKHLATLLVVIATILCVQVVLQVHKHLAKVRDDVASQRAKAEGLEAQLRIERSTLAQLQNSSAALLAYLQVWEPALVAVDSPEGGELDISGRVKDSGLISLAQRFEAVPLKNANIPRVVRANLTIEDDYARTLNWLGKLEHDLPAARVSDLRITRGQTGNDIRMDLVLDLPLLKKEAAQ